MHNLTIDGHLVILTVEIESPMANSGIDIDGELEALGFFREIRGVNLQRGAHLPANTYARVAPLGDSISTVSQNSADAVQKLFCRLGLKTRIFAICMDYFAPTHRLAQPDKTVRT